MPLRREGGAAAEEDLAVLGIDITTSFFVSMVVVFVMGHKVPGCVNEAAGRLGDISGSPPPARPSSDPSSPVFFLRGEDLASLLIFFLLVTAMTF